MEFKNDIVKNLDISETYIVSFDISKTDDSVMTVATRGYRDSLKVVRTVIGKEAEEIYKKLTNKNIDSLVGYSVDEAIKGFQNLTNKNIGGK